MTTPATAPQRLATTLVNREPAQVTAVTLPWHRLAPAKPRRIPASGPADPTTAVAPARSMAPVAFGKYQLLRHLDSGDNAHVFLARLECAGGFSRHLAIKTLRRHHLHAPASIERFLDEARFLAALHHRNIVAVSDVGITEDGTHYLAMDYIHGETLRQVIAAARACGACPDLDFALTVVSAAAAALEHVHERHGKDGQALELVHRELAPSNLMVAYDGGVTLLDFGSAKAASRLAYTPMGVIRGQLGYMAPEQAAGKSADRRSDVYALGILLYELTTMHHPFGDDERALRIPHDRITPPTQVTPGYPAVLEQVVMTALAHDPARRYPDCAALGRALTDAAHHLELALGPRPVRQALAQLFGAKAEPWINSGVDANGGANVGANEGVGAAEAVSYTHLTLPTNREV